MLHECQFHGDTGPSIGRRLICQAYFPPDIADQPLTDNQPKPHPLLSTGHKRLECLSKLRPGDTTAVILQDDLHASGIANGVNPQHLRPGLRRIEDQIRQHLFKQNRR